MNIPNDPKPKNALETGDVFRCEALGKGEFIVTKARYGGGGIAQCNDVYSNGWQVYYQKLNSKVILDKNAIHNFIDGKQNSFAMSGCFNNMISSDQVEKIGRMKLVQSFVWE